MTNENSKLDAERAEFEDAAREICLEAIGKFVTAKSKDGSYRNQTTRMLRDVWNKARASLPVGVPDSLTEIERKAMVGLIELASHAFSVADNGEDAGGETISVPRCDMDDLGKALDSLDELPDDMPGYTLGLSGRAEWALRRFFGGKTIAGQDHAAPTVKAEQSEPFELRLCEQYHTVFQPDRHYLFTVDPNCEKCAAIARGAAPSAPAGEAVQVGASAMSDKAFSTLRGMVEYCLNARVCMGMDEGFASFEPEIEHDFVKELRAFAEDAPTVKAGPWKCEQCDASTGEACNSNGCFANERSAAGETEQEAVSVSTPDRYSLLAQVRKAQEAMKSWPESLKFGAQLVGGESVSVPRELALRLAKPGNWSGDVDFWNAVDELRALLSRNGNGGE